MLFSASTALFSFAAVAVALPIPTIVPPVKRQTGSSCDSAVAPTVTPTTLGEIQCVSGAAALDNHDCNVALLSLGGGIAGEIEFLRVDSPTNEATSGTCTVSIQTTDGGNIDISKGRLEHGGVAGFDNLLDQCADAPGTVLIQGGSANGGDSLVTISASSSAKAKRQDDCASTDTSSTDTSSTDTAAATPTTAGEIQCVDGAAALDSHDCNVALLSLGGGIAGEIEFLRVDATSNSATSGSCTVSIATTDGGNIDISKGRLEHGGVAGFDNLLDQCGAAPGTVLVEGGSTNGGNSLVSISAA